MQVRDGMSEIILTVGPSHTLREAAQKMVERGTGAALVIDAEMPTPSIVTERDLLISVAQGQNPDLERVADRWTLRFADGTERPVRIAEASTRGVTVVADEYGAASAVGADPERFRLAFPVTDELAPR